MINQDNVVVGALYMVPDPDRPCMVCTTVDTVENGMVTHHSAEAIFRNPWKVEEFCKVANKPFC